MGPGMRRSCSVLLLVLIFSSARIVFAEDAPVLIESRAGDAVEQGGGTIWDCEGHVCGTDCAGYQQQCCSCPGFLNSSGCCYGTFCRCDIRSISVNGVPLWCTTDCPCGTAGGAVLPDTRGRSASRYQRRRSGEHSSTPAVHRRPE